MTMAKFFVGQRVRILWSDGWPELKGEQGTIVAKALNAGLRGISEWEVAPDTWGTHKAPHPAPDGGEVFAPNSAQLEPLIKPDNVVGSWEKLGWHPSEFLAKNPSQFLQQKEETHERTPA